MFLFRHLRNKHDGFQEDYKVIASNIKSSILRQLFVSFIGFGLVVAIIFPFYAGIFVEWKPGMYSWFVAGCVVAGLSIGVANYYLVKIVLLKRMTKLASLITAISDKDVSQKCGLVSNDMLGDIATGMNQMTENLRDMILHINRDAEELTDASGQMSSVLTGNSDDIQNQLSQVEKVATAMKEMAASALQVANHAEEAAKVTANADDQGSKSKVVVVEAMSAVDMLADMVGQASTVINNLESESENIGSVLAVINGIAEQTNLLALNAAIEAARAGEHGRGFAVVADEVRTLANRTQQSTEEISNMIDRLQSGTREAVSVMDHGREQATKGVELTESAVELLSEISGSIGTLKSMSEQIADASKEQSTVIEEVNQNIVAINDVSTQTNQSMRDVANTSQDVARSATELRDLVSDFKTS